MIDVSSYPEGRIDEMRTPLKWDDITGEMPTIINRKKELARKLGVPAVLFTQQEVRARIESMALYELLHGHPDSNVYVGLLNGAMPFIGQFFPQMAKHDPTHHPLVRTMVVSRYEADQEGHKILKIVNDLDEEVLIKARKITIVDEVGDMGDTVRDTRLHLHNRFKRLTDTNNLSFGLRLLTDKGIADYQKIGFDLDNVMIGATVPVAWISGMGMDGANETYRWWPEITLSPVQDEKYREAMPEILDVLGERALFGMDDFTWVVPKT